MAESAGNYSIAEQVKIPLALRREGVTLFHAPHYVLPPTAQVLADIIHFCRQAIAMSLSFGVMVSRQHDLRIESSDRINLDIRRRLRHDDDGPYSEMLRRKCDALRVIAGARRDDTDRAFRLR